MKKQPYLQSELRNKLNKSHKELKEMGFHLITHKKKSMNY